MPKPKIAAVEDALPDPDVVEIEFNGETFTVPRERDDWSTESTLAFYRAVATNLNHDFVTYVELALGPEQWARFLRCAPKRGDLVAFVNLFVSTTNSECVA